MKILHLISSLQIGGAEKSLTNFLQNTKAFYSHFVVSLNGGGYYEQAIKKLDIPVTIFSFRSFKILLEIIKLKNLVKRLNPNLIFCWMYHANLIGYILFKNTYPLIWNIRHSLDNLKTESFSTKSAIVLNKKYSANINKIIFNSKTALKQHLTFGFYAKNSLVIQNGFDILTFSPDKETRLKFRKKIGIADDEILIGNIGRFHHSKDHRTFIEAIKILTKTKPEIKIRLLFAGKNTSYENQTFISLFGAKKTLLEKSILLGEYPNISEAMKSLDLLCLSSVTESFPNVIGEAMACGVPVVATQVGDVEELIKHKEFIVPPSKPDLLAQALIKICELDQNRRRELGLENRKYICESFSLEKSIEKYKSLIQHIKLNK